MSSVEPALQAERVVSLPVARLLSYCDPFERNVWGARVSREAVGEALASGRLVADHSDKSDPAGRIAYLVTYPADDPIEIDVGSPGCFNEWIITDGNHRLAAALIRGDVGISCRVSGYLPYVEQFLDADPFR